MVDAFHGTVITWARQKKMFGRHEDLVAEINQPGTQDLDHKWRLWAKREVMIRVTLGLYIHDAELANLFQHEPCLRRIGKTATSASSNRVFMARKPDTWYARYTLERESDHAEMGNRVLSGDLSSRSESLNSLTLNCWTSYARLQSISATILEERLAEQLDERRRENFVEQLMHFYKCALSTPPSGTNDRDDLGVYILWHSCFISLFADHDLLQRVVGRDGPCASETDKVEVRRWANSTDAKRCIAHISLLHKRLENMSVGFEPAIQVPRTVFVAAIVWYCYTQYLNDGAGSDNTRQSSQQLRFQEIAMLGHNASTLVYEMHGLKHNRPTNVEANEVLCRFIDLLQRIGHWEIAHRFAGIVRTLVYNDALTIER